MSDESKETAEELAARLEAAEREIAELRAEKKQLEHRVINANRTLAYGLGRAVIEARSFKGLLAFPRKIRRLRLKQRAKTRERVPDTLPVGIAERLKLVDPALERLREAGPEAAASWVRAENAPADAKARALAELALAVAEEAPETAISLAEEAAISGGAADRLAGLVTRLREQGVAALRPGAEDTALAKSEFGLEGDGPLIACLGTATEDDGYRAFFDGFATLYEAGVRASVAVIGSGDQGPWLAAEAERRGIGDALHILGEPLPLRWPALLGAMDVIVCPRTRPEPPGSDISAMARIASALGKPQLFGTGWPASDTPPIGDGDWAGAIRDALASDSPTSVELPDVSSLIVVLEDGGKGLG